MLVQVLLDQLLQAVVKVVTSSPLPWDKEYLQKFWLHPSLHIHDTSVSTI